MGFRSPSLKEKYYNFDMAGIWIVLGNPNLKPERSHNFNVSAEYAHAGYNITISSFYNKIDNKLSKGISVSSILTTSILTVTLYMVANCRCKGNGTTASKLASAMPTAMNVWFTIRKDLA